MNSSLEPWCDFMSHAPVNVCPFFTEDSVLAQIPSSWLDNCVKLLLRKVVENNISKMPFCQRTAWPEAGTEKRTVLKGRSHLFHGMPECSV